MSKHTPGPWKLDAGRCFDTSSGRFFLSYGTEPRTGRPYFENFCELDSNARLIAAAPDLLEALRGLMRDPEGSAARDAAWAAIAKAEGTP